MKHVAVIAIDVASIGDFEDEGMERSHFRESKGGKGGGDAE